MKFNCETGKKQVIFLGRKYYPLTGGTSSVFTHVMSACCRGLKNTPADNAQIHD